LATLAASVKVTDASKTAALAEARKRLGKLERRLREPGARCLPCVGLALMPLSGKLADAAGLGGAAGGGGAVDGGGSRGGAVVTVLVAQATGLPPRGEAPSAAAAPAPLPPPIS